MNKRLAWNFEINSDSPLTLPSRELDLCTDSHWESRFFWQEHEIITLSGLDDLFLDLSRYKIKHHSDRYYLLPNADYNIKARRDELFYKPVIKRKRAATAFGKKVKLKDQTTDILGLNGERIEPKALILLVQNQGKSIQVDKEAIIYQFPSHTKTRLELSRLTIGGRVYYSLSAESPELAIVEHLTQHIVLNQNPLEYVTFLKNSEQA